MAADENAKTHCFEKMTLFHGMTWRKAFGFGRDSHLKCTVPAFPLCAPALQRNPPGYHGRDSLATTKCR
jgi:hypothetical protein